MKNRSSLIMHRWLAVILQGIFAGIFSVVFVAFFQHWLDKSVGAIGSLGLMSASTIYFGVLATVSAAACRGRAPAALGYPHFAANPPTWLTLCIGVGTAYFLSSTKYDFSECNLGLILGLSSVLAGAVWGWWSTSPAEQPAAKSAPSDPPVLTATPECISAWLDEDDTPIRSPRFDFFNRTQYAIRILSRLVEHTSVSHVDPTFSVRGAAGTGKTSIYELMEYFLCNTDELADRAGTICYDFRGTSRATSLTMHADFSRLLRFRFIRVSAWKFSDAQSLIEGVINEVVRKIHEQADALSLVGASQEYVDAISKGGGWAAFFSRLLTVGFSSPEAVIGRISDGS